MLGALPPVQDASVELFGALRFFDDPLYVLCIGYLIAVPLLERACKKWDIYTPYKQHWKRVIVAYNFALAAYSLCSSLLMSYALTQNGIFHMAEHANWLYAFVGRVFYWSKYVEFMDTVFLILAGKPVSWLQYLHHAGAPLDMGVHSNYGVPSMWIFVALNGFIHTIMYTYYAFTILKWQFPFKQMITSLQLLQFFSGLAIVSRYPSVSGFWDCQPCRVAWLFNVAYVTVLIVLFANFYLQTYLKQGKRKIASPLQLPPQQELRKFSDSSSPASTVCPSSASPSGSDADTPCQDEGLRKQPRHRGEKVARISPTRKEESVKILYKGSEIDVTSWQNKHPGGPKVLKIFNGRDATSAIVAMHSLEAVERIEKMAKEPNQLEPIVADYVQLVQAAKREGLFAPCWGNEAFKAFYSFGSFAAGVTMLRTKPWTGAFLIAFGWFQLGWLGHDWSHHTALASSTTKWAQWCDVGGALCGAVRGTTLLWWKLRHNTHHVVTNQLGQDPDIRTSPLLRFFEDFEPNNVTKWQAVYYVPALFLLHLYWYIESWQVTLRYIASSSKPMRAAARRDVVGMTLHTVGIAWLAATTRQYIAILVAYALSGFGTAIVVFASHYAEERIDEHETLGFLEQTMKTTRNIGGFLPFGLDDGFWFHLTGGLSHQIEHHLFPMMPRANLRRMTVRLKALAGKHHLTYMESHLGECTMLAMQRLAANVRRNMNSRKKD